MASLQTVKTYEIHDNGGRPFIVHDYGTCVDIFVQRFNDKKERYDKPKFYMNIPYKRIFVGDDIYGYGVEHRDVLGNSILLELASGNFIYIGWKIQQFSLRPNDTAVEFVSYVGNNDVPYSYLVGKKYTYLLIEEKFLSNEYLEPDRDSYTQYYGHQDFPLDAAQNAFILPMKIIHDRL